MTSHLDLLEQEAEAELWLLKNCGIGSGGFQPGNTCARGGGGAGNDAKERAEARTRGEGDSFSEGEKYNWKPAEEALLKGRGDLDEEQKKAIKSYTGNGYEKMNNHLRDGRPLTPKMQKIQDAAARELPSPQIVYRGVSNEGDFADSLRQLVAGDEVTASGFVSTTLSPTVASSMSSTIMEIRPKRGVYIDDVVKSKKGERELIQAHGTKYKFLGAEDAEIAVNYGSGKKKVRLFMLEEI